MCIKMSSLITAGPRLAFHPLSGVHCARDSSLEELRCIQGIGTVMDDGCEPAMSLPEANLRCPPLALKAEGTVGLSIYWFIRLASKHAPNSVELI